MTTVVSSLVVEIGSDIVGLTSGLNKAEKRADGFIDSLGGGMVNVGKTMTAGLTLPLLAFGTVAANQAMEFEASMTNTASVLGITGTAFDDLSDKVLAVGSTAQAGPQAVADAFYDIVGGVQDSSTHMAILNAAIATSEAGAANLQATTGGLIAVMNAYNLEAGDATGVSDVFTRTVGMGVGTMDEFVSALSPIAGIAAGVGISFEDLGLQAAYMTTKGFSASQAATRIQAAITAIIKPNKDMAAGLKAIGVESGTAALEQYGLAGTLGRLEGAFAGSTDAMAGALGTTEALGAAMILNQPGLETFWETYADGLTGATAAARKIQLTSAAAKFDLLKSAVSGLTISIGAALLPVLGSIADFVSPIITGFETLMIDNPQLASTIVAVGAALAIAGPALVVVGGAMTGMAPVAAALGLSIGGLVAIVAGLAIGIGALAYLSQSGDLAILGQNIQSGIGTALQHLGVDGTAIDLTGMKDSIVASFVGLDFSSVQTTMESHFNDILGAIVTVAGLVFGGPVGLAIGAARLVSSAIDTDFLGIGTFLKTSGITASVEGALNDVKATIDGVLQSVFGGGGAGNGDVVAQFAAKTGDSLGSAGPQLSGPLALFVSDLEKGFTGLQKIASDVWANIGPGISDLATGIQGFVTNLSGTETDGLLRVLTGIGGAIGAVVGVVVEIGSDVFGTVLSAIGDALPAIGSAINDFISALSNLGQGDIGGFVSGLADSLIDIGQSVMDFVGVDIKIPDFSEMLQGWRDFGDSLGTIIQVGRDQIDGFFNGVAVGIRTFGRDIEDFITRVGIAKQDYNLVISAGTDTDSQTRKDALVGNINAIELAKDTESTLNSGMAAGNIMLDPSKYIGVDYTALASKIADPLLIQGALSAAMAEGDQGALSVLLPLATELGLDTQSIVDQFAAGLTTAGAAQIYAANLTADVLVSAGKVDLGPLRGAINAAIANGNLAGGVPSQGLGAAGGNTLTAQAAPRLDTGGDIVTEGLAYLHPAETVLNKEEAKAYKKGQGSGQSVGTMNFYGLQDVDGLIAELNRRGYSIPRTS